MALPKVKFEKLDIIDNLNILIWYSKPENSKNSPLNFYDFTLRLFPELDGKLKENMKDDEVYLILDKYVKPILKDLYDNSDVLEKYQSIWDKVNDNVMKELEDKLDIKWNCENIICYVGLLPICPRDILGKSYYVNYGLSKDDILSAGIHELCHFIYFDKWMDIYQNYNEEEFDYPHIAWYLSEAMIDPLINNGTFKKYTNNDLSAYSVFYDMYIGNESVIDILRSYVNNYKIEEAIKKGYELFKNNENLIKGMNN